MIPNARLCKAVLDRITDRAHIIDTGHESYRFRRTIEQRQPEQEAVDAADGFPRAPTAIIGYV